MRFSNTLSAALLVACAALPAHAGDGLERLRIDRIVAHVPLTGTPPQNVTWSPDGSRYAYTVPGPSENGPPILRLYDLRTRSDRALLSANTSARGSRSREIAQVVWSPDASRLALVDGDALEIATAGGTVSRPLASGVDDPQWSPDGTRIAYVRGSDLCALDVRTGAIRQLTHDGNATRINGDPDWLYSEELDVAHAYRWSPDGRTIAYLSFDESPVAPYPIEQFLSLPLNAVERQRYPLAGAANPRVSLRVVSASGGPPRLLYDGGPHDEYLVSFAWTPDSAQVVDEILDRPQRRLRLTAFPRAGGPPRTLLRESDARFVDVSAPPHFIAHGAAFLWISEREGVSSLYRVSTADGAAQRLSGTIPIGALEAVDEAHDRAYVHALYPTRREHALLAFSLARASRPIDLTPERGSHAVAMPEHGTSFIDTYSRFTRTPVVLRRSTRGGPGTVIFATPSLARYALGASSLLSIDSPWGPLDATLVLPVDFDPAKRYPAIVTIYGGPLTVEDGGEADDRWPGLFPHLLAERGFISLAIDGPASRNDRAENVRSFSGAMGEVAIRGPLAAADWLRRQSYVDSKRLGLFGWSYGGYLTAYTLTHAPQTFASGIAGAPPVDWRLYDTAYTERYLGTPEREAAAYERTAILPAAAKLQAKLLVLQGSSDDNVHLANSMALLAAFVRAGKPVDYFVFPGARHGPRGTASTRYLDAKMLDWWERTLRG